MRCFAGACCCSCSMPSCSTGMGMSCEKWACNLMRVRVACLWHFRCSEAAHWHRTIDGAVVHLAAGREDSGAAAQPGAQTLTWRPWTSWRQHKIGRISLHPRHQSAETCRCDSALAAALRARRGTLRETKTLKPDP